MVSNILLLYINQRLVEIFGCNSFADLTVILCRYFFQLPPILAGPIYSNYNDEWQNIVHLWKMYKLVELTEVMHQKGGDTFIYLLNNIRTATRNDQDYIYMRYYKDLLQKDKDKIISFVITHLNNFDIKHLINSIRPILLNTNSNHPK